MTSRIHNPDTGADIELQKCLASDDGSSFVMIAGAGSGKTTSLIKALDYIKTKYGEGLKQRGQKVACITYTTVAENEILIDVGHDPLFHVSTIHSFLWSLIKPFQTDIKCWVIQRIEERLEKLKNKQDGFGPRVHQKTRDDVQRDIDKYQEQRTAIEQIKYFMYGTGSDYSEGILGHDDIIRMGPSLIQLSPLLRKITAQKYPFFFVDESQDTVKEVVDALKKVEEEQRAEFCLGFFGDPMQQIYMTGIGEISKEDTWTKINKPENFRCPDRVLKVINKIRAEGDGFEQTHGGLKELGEQEGTARLFVLPSNGNRGLHIKRVRNWLSKVNEDPLWLSNEQKADVRILVIVHLMAAKRLGFEDLHKAFNASAPESFRSGFREGTAWTLKPFQEFLLPLVDALKEDRSYEVMTLLRTYCPKLFRKELGGTDNSALLLQSLKEHVAKLATLMGSDGSYTVLDVLQYVHKHQLMDLEQRLFERFSNGHLSENEYLTETQPQDEDEDEAEKMETALQAHFSCPASQLKKYQTYIQDESPYSTQQGIKGAEFERVMVILDDEEGSAHRLFSYEKLLGIKEPSATDERNIRDNKDSVFDRTRRLFYVCCSRARKDLAVVLFTPDPEDAVKTVKKEWIFEEDCIHTLEDLSF